MAPEHEEPNQPRPHKRRKVAESCKVCRAKKTRCDGRRPACSSCMEKDAVCEYNDATVPISAGTLSEIEARLRRLEQQANGVKANVQSANDFPSLSGSLGMAVSTIGLKNNSSSLRLASLVEQSNQSVAGGLGTLRVQTDLIPNETDRSSDEPLPIPDHSTTQFIQEITRIADSQPSANICPALWGKAPAWTIETDTTAMVIPRRAVADDLLECYERYYFHLFPILHMPAFRQRYARLWEPRGESEHENLASEAAFHATLNIVFALGCLNNSKVEPPLKLRTSDSFYRRARVILPLDALDVPSLEVVQYLLLTTNYLTYTKYSSRCWNTMGMAIRIAQMLRLHMDIESSSNQLKREMGRRVWYHCVTLERLLATIFGQQVMPKSEHLVPLPERIDDEYLREDGIGCQPAEMPSSIDSFITTISIFDVIKGVGRFDLPLGSLSCGLGLSELTQVLELNEKLDQIENNLPDHLKRSQHPQPCSKREEMFRLQAIAVMTRILHIRLVLLRPNVLAAARQTLKPSTPSPRPSRAETALRAEISALCIRTAEAAVEMLHGNLHSSWRMLSSNAAFVTLSAATVILAASLVPELDVSLEGGGGGGRGSHGDVISKAILVLEEHRWQFEGAAAAKEQLEKFSNTIDKAKRLRSAARSPLANDGNEAALQTPEERLLSGLPHDIIGDDFDFSDPLWNFQWGAPASMMDIQGYTF